MIFILKFIVTRNQLTVYLVVDQWYIIDSKAKKLPADCMQDILWHVLSKRLKSKVVTIKATL